MGSFPSVTSKELVRILKKRGFILDRTKGSHRIYIHTEQKIRVIVPFHAKELPKGTLLAILRQAGIDKDEL